MTEINVGGLAPQPPATGKTYVSTYEDKVVLHFEKPIEYAVYAPAGAISDGAKLMLYAVEAEPRMGQLVIDVAMSVIDGVYENQNRLKPAGGAAKHELMERHRRTLTKRLEVMLNSTREKRTVPNAKLAQELVESCLKEVFSGSGYQ